MALPYAQEKCLAFLYAQIFRRLKADVLRLDECGKAGDEKEF